MIGGALMVALSVRLFTAAKKPAAEQAAKQLFAFSILYLFVLFAVLLVEQGMDLSRLRLVIPWLERNWPRRKTTMASFSPSSRKRPAAPARSRLRLSLGALVILFYAITLVKGPGVLNRPL